MLGAPRGSERERTYLMVALVLGAVAAVGLSTGVLIGLADSGPDLPQRRAKTTQTVLAPSPPPPSPTPSQRPTTRADSDVEPGRTSDVGYALSSTREDDGVHLTFDRVQVLAGDVVVNENPRTRELVLAPDALVSGGPSLAGTPALTELSVEELIAALATRGRTTVLELSYNPLGYVVEVREKIRV